jgi:hypothetical protein
LKPEYFGSEIMLEGIGTQTVISGSKLHAVPAIKFNADMVEDIVTAAMEDQDWPEAYTGARDSNPNANVEYLYGAFYYKERL